VQEHASRKPSDPTYFLTEVGEFLYHLNDYELIKNGSASWIPITQHTELAGCYGKVGPLVAV
jgi:hypothetical protein